MKNIIFVTLVLSLFFLACSKNDGSDIPPAPAIPEGHAIEFTTQIIPNSNLEYNIFLELSGKATTVDWGDGTREQFECDTIIKCAHTYLNSGLYKVKIQTDELIHFIVDDSVGVITSGIKIDHCPKLKSFRCSGQDSIKSLNLNNCPALKDLVLACPKIRFVSIDKCTNLETLFWLFIENISLNISNNHNLLSLRFMSCKLNYIDLTNNTKLQYLIFEGGNLPSLDISNNHNLLALRFIGCKLNYIDLTNNTKLQYLMFEDGNLSSLDISNNPDIEYLSCTRNNLSSINLGENTNLEYINCGYNRLTSLDVSKTPQLYQLHCTNNYLGKESLENIFNALPVSGLSKPGETSCISFFSNPGAEYCSTESLTLKGWEIYDNNFKD